MKFNKNVSKKKVKKKKKSVADTLLDAIPISDEEIKELTVTDSEPIGEITVVEPTDIVPVETSNNNDQEADYKYVRDNLHKVIDQGTTSLEELCKFAKDSQSPRAYEVISQTIRTLSESNEKLLNIHKQMKELEKGQEAQGGQSQNAGTINNIVFQGTTGDVLDEIITRRKKLVK